MPKKIAEKVAFDSKWLQVVELTIEAKDGRQTPYYMNRYPWSNSTGVAILCYRDVEYKEKDFPSGEFPGEGHFYREYLGRFEYLPAHGEEMKLSSITGGYDKPGESYLECAMRELEEEGGLTTTSDKVIPLGTIRNSKSSDNIMHLFAVDVKDCFAVTMVGDGTIGEEGSYVKWVSEHDAVWSEDTLLPTMIQRLQSL